MPRPLHVAFCLTILAACESALDTPQPVLPDNVGLPHADDNADEVRIQLDGMLQTWTRDGDWLVSPAIAGVAGVERTGALVEVNDAAHVPTLEAQLLHKGAVIVSWQPLLPTFGEGVLGVAVAHFPARGSAAQLRVRADEVDWLRSVQWNATIPQAQVADVEPTATKTGALSAPWTGFGIVSRSDWKARATKCTSADKARTRIAIHHTETPADNPAARVRAIQAFHMDTRGWCDIGYHFLVATDGTVYEGRPYALVGAHTGNNNSGNVGVSFIGCFHSKGCDPKPPTTPPPAMLESAAHLLGSIRKLEGIVLDSTHVKGHRDHSGASTDCPGDHLHAKIGLLMAIGTKTTLDQPGEPQVPVEKPPEPPKPDPTAPCASLTCGACLKASMCGWCTSKGACSNVGDACAWQGGLSACAATVTPCTFGACWNPTLAFPVCASTSKPEDFSSGKFSVHRYWTTLPAGETLTLRVNRTAGAWQPALVVTDQAGKLVSAGDKAPLHAKVQVLSVVSGRAGDFAQVQLLAQADTPAFVHVTSWEAVDGSLLTKLPTSATYSLTLQQDCAATPPVLANQVAAYAGLSQAGMEIPRAGLANPTLQSVFGLGTEPYGALTPFGGGSWVAGKVSEFGGPLDTGVTPTETGAISGEVLRQLNNPLNPASKVLLANADKYYYIAMRFNYQPAGKAWWKSARIVVANPKTGKAVVVRPVDWGPNVSTKRVGDLSPQVLKDLGLQTDDTALFAFAKAGAVLGVQ